MRTNTVTHGRSAIGLFLAAIVTILATLILFGLVVQDASAATCTPSGALAQSARYQVPEGATVLYRGRVTTKCGPAANTTVTIYPHQGAVLDASSLTFGGVAGATCAPGGNNSITCSIPLITGGQSFNIRANYVQGPWLDSQGVGRICVNNTPYVYCSRAQSTLP